MALLALEEFLGDAHVGRLADVLGLTHSGAVRLVTQLERDGTGGAAQRRGPAPGRGPAHRPRAGAGRAAARAARDDVVRGRPAA